MSRSCFPRLFLLPLLIIAANAGAQTFKSEGDFKKYFTEHSASLTPIEGLWSVNTSQEFFNYDTLYDEKSFSQVVAVVKKDSSFVSYDMKGVPYNVFFSNTEVAKVYLFKIYLKEINEYTKADAVISAGSMIEYKYEFPESYLRLVLKGSFERGDRVINKVKWSKTFPK